MRNSPFELFRRNQRLMMVVLTGLSMFAFIFLDTETRRSGRVSPALVVAMVALVIGGLLWMLGAPRGKGSEWGLWGALLGAVVGFIAVRHHATGNVVDTAVGGYSRSDLQEMAHRRSHANRFVISAAKGRAPHFGGTDDRSLVVRAVLLTEAHKNGIRVSDEGIVDYIQKITENKLSLPDYRKILKDLGLPEGELFNILREELEARLVGEMETPQRSRLGAMFGIPTAVQTPLAYWKEFEKLQVKETVDAVEIPVAEFVAQVPEPKDEELRQFFEAFKNRLPSPDGNPGFLRNRQVQLAYLSADFEDFEKTMPEPTDTEVAEYYTTHKERYRVRDVPDFPTDTSRMPEYMQDRGPASALEPQNVLPEKPEQPPEPALPEGGCGGDEEPAATENSNPPRKQGATATDQPKSEETKPGDETKLVLPPGPGAPGTPILNPGDASKTPEVKYQELDDNLRFRIREEILKERAVARMNDAANRGEQEMIKLADEYLNAVEEKTKVEVAAKFPKRLEQFAEENNLHYVEAKPMTQQELMGDLTIGLAASPSVDLRNRGDFVAREAFANDALYSPRRANSFRNDKCFAYWKITDTPAKAPEFLEVKDQVVEAWKYFQARPRAEKRAKELAELVKTSGKPLAEALAGQTVTGETGSAAVAVRETSKFSWLNVPRNVPFQYNQGFSPPEISRIDGVNQPGEEFMRVAFEALKPGETGVAPNQALSDYYLIHVRQRDPAPSEDGDNLAYRALQQQFLSEGRTSFLNPTYIVLAQVPQNDIENRWQQTFEKRYNIVWHEREDDRRPRAEP